MRSTQHFFLSLLSITLCLIRMNTSNNELPETNYQGRSGFKTKIYSYTENRLKIRLVIGLLSLFSFFC